MVKKYVFGTPIETDAVVKEIKETSWKDDIFQKEGNVFHYLLKPDEIVYGLGENATDEEAFPKILIEDKFGTWLNKYNGARHEQERMALCK